MRILAVEDDEKIASFILNGLKHEHQRSSLACLRQRAILPRAFINNINKKRTHCLDVLDPLESVTGTHVHATLALMAVRSAS
jgi:hypothetical protein